MIIRDADTDRNATLRRLRAPAPQGARDAARRLALVTDIVERAVLPALLARKDSGAFASPGAGARNGASGGFTSATEAGHVGAGPEGFGSVEGAHDTASGPTSSRRHRQP